MRDRLHLCVLAASLQLHWCSQAPDNKLCTAPPPSTWASLDKKNCSYHEMCGSCVRNPKCGWCYSTGKCVEGSAKEGAFNKSTCPDTTWSLSRSMKDPFNFGICHPEACTHYTTCHQCTTDPQCGWCQNERTCGNALYEDPFSGTCQVGWSVKSCPGCSDDLTLELPDPEKPACCVSYKMDAYNTRKIPEAYVPVETPVSCVDSPTSDVRKTFEIMKCKDAMTKWVADNKPIMPSAPMGEALPDGMPEPVEVDAQRFSAMATVETPLTASKMDASADKKIYFEAKQKLPSVQPKVHKNKTIAIDDPSEPMKITQQIEQVTKTFGDPALHHSPEPVEVLPLPSVEATEEDEQEMVEGMVEAPLKKLPMPEPAGVTPKPTPKPTAPPPKPPPPPPAPKANFTLAPPKPTPKPTPKPPTKPSHPCAIFWTGEGMPELRCSDAGAMKDGDAGEMPEPTETPEPTPTPCPSCCKCPACPQYKCPKKNATNITIVNITQPPPPPPPPTPTQPPPPPPPYKRKCKPQYRETPQNDKMPFIAPEPNNGAFTYHWMEQQMVKAANSYEVLMPEGPKEYIKPRHYINRKAHIKHPEWPMHNTDGKVAKSDFTGHLGQSQVNLNRYIEEMQHFNADQRERNQLEGGFNMPAQEEQYRIPYYPPDKGAPPTQMPEHPPPLDPISGDRPAMGVDGDNTMLRPVDMNDIQPNEITHPDPNCDPSLPNPPGLKETTLTDE